MKFTLFFFLLLALSQIKTIFNSQDEQEDEDLEEQKQFIDDTLEIIKNQIDNVTSVDIPIAGLNRYQDIFLVKNAEFLGLKSLLRDGDPYVHGIEVREFIN